MEIAIAAFLCAACAVQDSAAQRQVAHLAASLGRSYGLLAVAIAGAVLTCILAALAGAWLGHQLIGAERAAVVAGALALAAALLLGKRKVVLAREPTRSLGAIFFVLLARQAFDPARLLILAGGAMIADPIPAAIGGTIGSVLALSVAWYARKLPLSVHASRILHMALAVLVLLASGVVLWIGLNIGA